jgi:nucleotide-binding universal stress UspA family protein
MQTSKLILFATDFREASGQAAEVAVPLASALGAHVTVLHVVDVLPTGPLLERQYKEHALDLLRQTSDQLAARNVVVTALPIGVGSRADVIVRSAEEMKADLILMGAGELTAGDVFSLGSVTEAVIQ